MKCRNNSIEIADDSTRLSGSAIRNSSNWMDSMPLVFLTLGAAALRNLLEPWVFMWTLAFGIYAGCKWLTWRKGRGDGEIVWRDWAYLLAWPGLDAKSFLNRNCIPPKPRASAWVGAILKIAFGAAVVWLAVRLFAVSHPLVAGWTGMIGVVLMLHFGAFHLLALIWQSLGVAAAPLMHEPLRSASLAEFWGRRWNSAFNNLVHGFIFRPLYRRIGIPAATMAVFLVSGLIHDLVISFPARGGYGLPTLYFLIQGTGLLLERSRIGQRWGLRGGVAGRCYTLALAALPAFWLFHPPFIKAVILPMLRAIGAT